jgi:uncharacterized membrane protein YeaQ/YmgE (transglycosylase-associated protein family)
VAVEVMALKLRPPVPDPSTPAGTELARRLSAIRRRRQEENEMPFLSWIVPGPIVGFAGSKLVNKTGEGLTLDIAVGVAGAIVGGLAFNAAGASTPVVMNFWSLSVAAIASVLVLRVWHAFICRA